MMLSREFQFSLTLGEFRTGGHLVRGQDTPERAGRICHRSLVVGVETVAIHRRRGLYFAVLADDRDAACTLDNKNPSRTVIRSSHASRIVKSVSDLDERQFGDARYLCPRLSNISRCSRHSLRGRTGHARMPLPKRRRASTFS